MWQLFFYCLPQKPTTLSQNKKVSYIFPCPQECRVHVPNIFAFLSLRNLQRLTIIDSYLCVFIYNEGYDLPD